MFKIFNNKTFIRIVSFALCFFMFFSFTTSVHAGLIDDIKNGQIIIRRVKAANVFTRFILLYRDFVKSITHSSVHNAQNRRRQIIKMHGNVF